MSHYFPESKETQKGHMLGQQQGIHSTKKKPLNIFPDTPTLPPHESQSDICICIYKLKKTMFSDQMLKTEHSSPPSSPISMCPKTDDLLPITWNRESHPKSITWANQVRMPLAT